MGSYACAHLGGYLLVPHAVRQEASASYHCSPSCKARHTGTYPAFCAHCGHPVQKNQTMVMSMGPLYCPNLGAQFEERFFTPNAGHGKACTLWLPIGVTEGAMDKFGRIELDRDIPPEQLLELPSDYVEQMRAEFLTSSPTSTLRSSLTRKGRGFLRQEAHVRARPWREVRQKPYSQSRRLC